MVQHRVFPLFTKMVDPCLGCSCLILLKSTLSAAGIPISFSSPNYQIGAATMVAQQGLPDYQIKTMGRWSSNAYQLYVKTPVQSYSWNGRQVTITGTYSHGYTSGSDSNCQGLWLPPAMRALGSGLLLVSPEVHSAWCGGSWLRCGDCKPWEHLPI